MKRSQINAAIRWAETLCKEHHITLPDFARFAADRNEFLKPSRKNLVKTMLGWDVTDFGSGDFARVGAVLFTVRNGSVHEVGVGTPYAEKYIFLKDGCEQEIPLHYHIQKTEDIINRAGGIFCCQLAARGADGKPDFTRPVRVLRDGEYYDAAPGEIIEITTGNSITLEPGVYHRFFAKTGCGDLLIGEVSRINDDNTDNVFAVTRGRWCAVDEDEPRYRLLVNEYPEVEA
ncbi:MAG: D-lyxose/D-mannose family sugar isomerase [Clostridia bacterium]|nr:D-lyxose/D-mannose family sugar isomerase [Clostridia bacterium]